MKEVAAWVLRARLKEAIRKFFAAKGYLELDTPIAVISPGTEVHLRYFPTTWHDHGGAAHPLYLRSSPELHMKQAVAAGAARVFQIAPCFRNHGELSAWHHPEFTLLEWYQTGVSFEDFITQTEDLLHFTAAELELAGHQPLALKRPIPRLTVAEAFARFAHLTLVDSDPDLARQAVAKGVYSVTLADDFETAFFKILLEKVEPALKALGAVILHDYPPSQAALATVRGGVAKRFEFYINGVELCNGFEELLGEAANRARLAENLERRRALGHEVPAVDDDFFAALARGLPPCCGNALGFDRWLALLAGEPGIDALIPFRTARPYGKRN